MNPDYRSQLDDIKSFLSQAGPHLAEPNLQAGLAQALQALDALEEQMAHTTQEARLGALYRIAQAVGASLNLDEALNLVMDAVIELTHAARGCIVLVETDHTWRLRAGRNFYQETLQPRDLEVSRTIISRVLSSGQGLITTDAKQDPRLSGGESIILYELRSVLCHPLLAHGRIIGAIYVDNKAQSGIFTPADLDLLGAFASQAALAIENAALYTRTDQALNRRVSELETLARLDHALNAGLELRRTVALTHAWSEQISGVSRAWVWLEAAEGVNEGQPLCHPEEGLPLDDTVLPRALTSAQAEQEQIPTGWRLAAPLLHAGRAFGAILLERAEPFDQAAINFAGHLSGRAAAAIQNALLFLKVQQANQAKSKFVSVITHELRIPMTSIKGYADLLKAGVVGELNDQQLSFVGVIRNNVERMSALVSDLADISRIETGRIRLECRRMTLKEGMEDAARTFAPRLAEKQQTLTIEAPDDLPTVYADPNRVAQILNNLLSNASKYSPPERPIRITVTAQPGGIRVAVVDCGIGISPADQEKLFTQFFRSEEAAVREEQGWGLGLSVAQRLAQVMGGEMGFESSQAGQGSTFWFSLPYDDQCTD